MITTYLPGQASQQFVDVDVSRFNICCGSQGTQLSQTATLVLIPEQDDVQEKSSWKKSSEFLSSYFDKRAQASHPDIYASTLGGAHADDQKPNFASRYLDPNHPSTQEVLAPF